MKPRRVAATLGLGLMLPACGQFGDDTFPEAMSWWLAGVDGTALYLAVEHGACDEFDRVEVRESTGEISIAVIYTVSGGDCPAVALSECRVVTLQAPLGDRALVYGEPEPYAYSTQRPTPGLVESDARERPPTKNDNGFSVC